MKTKTIIDNREYDLDIIENITTNSETTRVLIPVFITNLINQNLTRVCLESLHKFSKEEVEVWVIDNNSPQKHTEWLVKLSQKLQFNVILNRTEPINPFLQHQEIQNPIKKYWDTLHFRLNKYPRGYQTKDGSYANAIGLEIGIRYINKKTKTIFTMHNDCIVTKISWLDHLKSKLDSEVRAVGFRIDPNRVNALHIAGLLIDYSLFEKLSLSFMPNMRQERYPNLPEYDVGDDITIKIKSNGYEIYYSPNTFNTPKLIELIDKESPFYQLSSDRCLDEENEIFYMHLGRGTLKSHGTYKSKNPKTTAEEWIQFAEKHLI